VSAREARPVPRYAFAHRGGRAHGGDNAIATFREALARGATGLETDAWLTSDGAVVLSHDGVHRVAKRRRLPMADLLREELPTHVPSLDELYDACGTDFDLAVDVRLPQVAAAVLAVARRRGATARLWLVAPAPSLLSAWRELDPDVHLAHTIRRADRHATSVREVAEHGGEALNMRWPWWTPSFVGLVRDAGLLAFGYDAQSRFALHRCVRLGLDGVFSDHVDRLVETCQTPRGR
jgi:glycerophosphoryl diester phosphodiesterase